ncbi:MAG: glucosaminidase domain-containing protein [Bacteroidales bacterium]|nr:glucosaminidase domain-containing protein [Bacteroidales bacterium]
MCDKKILVILLMLIPLVGRAEFYTITKENEIPYSIKGKLVQSVDTLILTEERVDSIQVSEAYGNKVQEYPETKVYAQKCYTYTSSEKGITYAEARGRIPRTNTSKRDNKGGKDLPELTIPNLLREIKNNGIKYPKIVLAQAILETGWFKSSVCRNKNNLFGLTNPRTKTYYEFDHWTESVAAYYSKVQYKYKGGNYLLWLRDIGYAEDKGYIQAVIRVLKQL